MQQMQNKNMQNKQKTKMCKRCYICRICKSYKTCKPNLSNKIYQTKPAYLTFQTKITKANQTQPTKLTVPNKTHQTKPKLLVKAVNAWVRSAFGNVLSFPDYFNDVLKTTFVIDK